MYEEYSWTDVQPNVLNTNDIETFTDALATNKPTHVKAYIKSTLHKWIQTHDARCLIQCVDKITANSPVYKMLETVLKTTGSQIAHRRVDAKALPAWAQQSLTENGLWWWQPPGVESNADILHWIDFLQTLPERQIRYTVKDLVIAVNEWDKQLAKQKVLSSLAEGVVLCETPSLSSYLDGDLYIVRLNTKAAFAAEGAAMSNCVNGYYGREQTEVYSLRRIDKERPLATVEVTASTSRTRSGKVTTKTVVQVKKYANAAPTTIELDAIQLWGADCNIIVNADSIISNRGHYYGDEDEDYETECEEEECEEVDTDTEDEPKPKRAARWPDLENSEW